MHAVKSSLLTAAMLATTPAIGTFPVAATRCAPQRRWKPITSSSKKVPIVPVPLAAPALDGN